MPAFRLAHISDLHLTPPPRGALELQPKLWLSRFAWRRKRRRHSAAALAAVIGDIKAQGADHIAITGDLTNFATAEELAAARAWLEALAPSDQVTVSPGNHDALVERGGRVRFAQWAPWLGDGEAAGFPQVRRRGAVALVNLCSAAPTAPHLAQGVLDPAQLARLPQMLRQLGDEGLFRVLLIHHPPAAGVVSRRKALRQGPELLSILRAEGAELVLHGHAHQASVATAPGPHGPIPILGVPPASGDGGHGEAARWHAIEIDRAQIDGTQIESTGGGWRVRVIARGRDAGGEMAELGRYVLAPVVMDSASAR